MPIEKLPEPRTAAAEEYGWGSDPVTLRDVRLKLNEVIEAVNRIGVNQPGLFDTPEGRKAASWFVDPVRHRFVREVLDDPELKRRMRQMCELPDIPASNSGSQTAID